MKEGVRVNIDGLLQEKLINPNVIVLKRQRNTSGSRIEIFYQNNLVHELGHNNYLINED